MTEPRVGLYLRLSREDEEKGESQSIANQREYLRQYASARGWSVAAIYTDDGYTGTNFDRPGFLRLLADVEAGRINTVLTKDLSRLGRDQIGTMYYYQIYFPQRRVRYIAVSEGIDTGVGGSGELILPFLAAANDFYTADISRKVRTALEVRKRSGRFIGAQPPMGYRKDPETPGRLIPDPETGPVIGLLFRTFLSCGSVSGTARALTAGGIPTPSQYKKGPQSRFPGLWSGTMVRRVLTNPTYAGHLTQNRARKVGYKVEKRVTLPREDWIVVPNTHQPLVSQQVFDRAQELLAVRSYAPQTGSGHLLTGLAFCGGCGSPMTYVRGRGRQLLHGLPGEPERGLSVLSLYAGGRRHRDHPPPSGGTGSGDQPAGGAAAGAVSWGGGEQSHKPLDGSGGTAVPGPGGRTADRGGVPRPAGSGAQSP